MTFNFWDFPIENIYLFKFPIHPIINIILKSILIAFIYIFLVIKFNISTEITNIVKRFYK